MSQDESTVTKMSDHFISFLHQTPLFDKLDQEELQQIFPIIEEVNCKADEIIFNEGDQGDAWYIVYRGTVDVLKDDRKIAVIGEKECFGEMAILEDLPRSATVVASQKAILLRIGKEVFQQLINENNLVAYKLAYEMAQLLASRQRVTTEWLSKLLKSDKKSMVSGIRGIVGDYVVNE